MPDKDTVLVTGANGFIGGWLAEAIFLSGGSNVRAGIRSWAGAARPARFPMDIALCDIMNPRQVEKAMDGVSRVIHCAKGPSEESIIQGTRNTLEAALRQGVKRFVYLSTAEVYGSQGGEIDEKAPLMKTGSPYGDSKIEAEEWCWEYLAKGLPVTVIRPSIVYGPFSNTWSLGIALKLQSGNWGIFQGHADGICNLIYIGDLVSGILLAAGHERAVGEAFNLNGPEAPTWNEYFLSFNTALGLPDLSVIEARGASLRATTTEAFRNTARFARDHFEGPVRRIASTFGPARHLMNYAMKAIKTTPRPTDFNLYRRNALYLATKAQDKLGFTPSFDVSAGLKMTVLWLNQVGLATQR